MHEIAALYNPPAHLPHLTIAPGADVAIRRACVDDVPRLYELIGYYAAQGVAEAGEYLASVQLLINAVDVA